MFHSKKDGKDTKDPKDTRDSKDKSGKKKEKKDKKDKEKEKEKNGKLSPTPSKTLDSTEDTNGTSPVPPSPVLVASPGPHPHSHPQAPVSPPSVPEKEKTISPRDTPPKETTKLRSSSSPEEPVTTTSTTTASKVTLNPPEKERDKPIPAVVRSAPGGGGALDESGLGILRNKIAGLPEGNRALVEYLINIFGKAVPSQWKAPANLEVPPMDEQVDVTLEKLVEASEILFNKDHSALLRRYVKEFNETPKRRAQKWKILESLLTTKEKFVDTFLTTNTLEASVRCALMEPLEDDEASVLADFLSHLLLRDMANKELIEVIKACSYSNEHVNEHVEEARTLSDSIVDLVSSFKKQSLESEDLPPIPEIPKDGVKKGDIDPSIGTSQSISLLHHVNILRHAKSGHDLSVPLEKFFQKQIVKEEESGKTLEVQSKSANSELTEKLKELDSSIENESSVLRDVLQEIKELELQLVRKKAEQEQLEENLAKQKQARENFKKEQQHNIEEISKNISESRLHLQHHIHSEETLKSFSSNIGQILAKEIKDTIRKSKEVLSELDKEVLFLEEKMASYERSYALFSGADEPEVLDGLKKLKIRSQAIYAESIVSVGRVKTVVESLHIVIGEGDEKSSMKEIETALAQIIQRQTALNDKYQLQK